jgi:hypothetical protein
MMVYTFHEACMNYHLIISWWEVREQNATVELDVYGKKQVGETHDTQQSKRIINKRKKNDTQCILENNIINHILKILINSLNF